MPSAPLSRCCRAEIHRDGFGHVLCGRCWNATRPAKFDLIDWLFPAEPGGRPSHEPTFVRYGRSIQLLRADQVRGHPDGWCWNDV